MYEKVFLEMQTTSSEKNQLRTIIEKLILGDSDWMKEKDILVGDKGPFWILNYGMKEKNEFNRLVRGMVVEKPTANTFFHGDDPLKLIKSFPFIRFFNQGEKESDEIDMSNSEMLEKLDGTMVGVFFPTKDPNAPQWHTRRMLSSDESDMKNTLKGFHGGNYNLMHEIGKYVKQLNFNQEDTSHTYVFEFIHDASTVLTKYKESQWGLYLLAGRNVETHKEETESELDEISKRIGANRPQRWDAVASEEEIKSMMQKVASEIEDFEGMVFRDRKTGKRVKLKDPSYVEKHHMLGDISFKRLIPKIIEGEEDEVIAYFPHAKELVDNIKERHANIKNKTVETVKQFQKYENLPRKELWEKASNIDNAFIRSMVMKHVESKDLESKIEEELKKIAVATFEKDTYLGKQTFSSASQKYLDLLGLK